MIGFASYMLKTGSDPSVEKFVKARTVVGSSMTWIWNWPNKINIASWVWFQFYKREITLVISYSRNNLLIYSFLLLNNHLYNQQQRHQQHCRRQQCNQLLYLLHPYIPCHRHNPTTLAGVSLCMKLSRRYYHIFHVFWFLACAPSE